MQPCKQSSDVTSRFPTGIKVPSELDSRPPNTFCNTAPSTALWCKTWPNGDRAEGLLSRPGDDGGPHLGKQASDFDSMIKGIWAQKNSPTQTSADYIKRKKKITRKSQQSKRTTRRVNLVCWLVGSDFTLFALLSCIWPDAGPLKMYKTQWVVYVSHTWMSYSHTLMSCHVGCIYNSALMQNPYEIFDKSNPLKTWGSICCW